ncbi:MAG TPA: NADH-quinone oxidoreductase subunit J, partial [Kofleriaceae bacterium]|nr:NADH-quinone oxidoreductase subunit J [Kofleriaceae bacterium]
MTRAIHSIARTLILVAVTAWISLGGVRTAHAQLDGDAVPAAPGACQPNVEAAVKAAVSGITSLRCVEHKTPTRHENNVTIAGQIDAITAHIALADGRTATVDVSPPDVSPVQVLGMAYDHNDLRGSSSKGMAVLFWMFALAAVGGALFVISRKNLIAAVMGMVGSFLGIAAIYMLLYAQFLAVVQMLVYAGAIMVLFVFVVMILNRPEDGPVAPSGRVGQAVGGIAILYLVGRLILMLIQVQVPDPKVALAAPLATAEGHDWGSIAAVGTDLFGPGLFPF